MSPIINPESAGKERTQLSKAIVLAVRELAKQTDITNEAKDLAAFIALSLKSISDGIDVSVAAWEKRGYWVKAKGLFDCEGKRSSRPFAVRVPQLPYSVEL
jgi:hypothetical protein